MKKTGNASRIFCIEMRGGFAHISTTGSLTDDNMKLGSGNIGFSMVPNFLGYNYLD